MDYKKFQEYEQRALSTVYEEGRDSFHNDLIPVLATTYLAKLEIDKNACILDIGCGPGQFMQSAAALGYTNTLGVTLSPEDLQACQDQNFETLSTDMSDLPLEDASVDFIWCRHALEHSPYPLFTLFEFARVLKCNCKMYVEVPAPDNERVMLGEYNPNHYSVLGENMWTALFMKAGFEILSTEGYSIDISQLGRVWKEKSYIFGVKKLEVSL
jgi:SAM-dependent methyltransferase